jgi:hypothetical protein
VEHEGFAVIVAEKPQQLFGLSVACFENALGLAAICVVAVLTAPILERARVDDASRIRCETVKHFGRRRLFPIVAHAHAEKHSQAPLTEAQNTAPVIHILAALHVWIGVGWRHCHRDLPIGDEFVDCRHGDFLSVASIAVLVCADIAYMQKLHKSQNRDQLLQRSYADEPGTIA